MRRSGVLLSVSSLPSPYGIGTLGKEAHDFIDYLKDAGQTVWQMLPLNPTGYGDSPYSSWSTLYKNPYFIDFEELEKDGLLRRDEYAWTDWGHKADTVDYGAMYNNRRPVLEKAVARIPDTELQRYLQSHPEVLEPAIFMALKKKHDMKAWQEWPAYDKQFSPAKIPGWMEELRPEIRYWIGTQYLFDRQYAKLKAKAEKEGIEIMGDIPFYANADSADVWAHPEWFQLDKNGTPTPVSGCPGQVWGNPLHDWEAQKKSGYAWWEKRIEQAADMYDILRLDHFIGFDQVYAIDPETKKGKYQKGPGMDLLGLIRSTGKEIIVEDLGDRTDSMISLLEESGFPGMMVLEYAFNDRMGEKSLYIPYNVPKHSVAYLGTHDNDTVMGWIDSLNPGDLEYVRDFVHSYGNAEQLNWDMVRTLMATAAETVILQAQDLKALDARMNKPGEAMGNWTWRLEPGMLDAENANWVRKITETYARLNEKEKEKEEEKEDGTAEKRSGV